MILGPITQRIELSSEDFIERVNILLDIDYNSCNWSWVLDPHKPVLPPLFPKISPQ